MKSESYTNGGWRTSTQSSVTIEVRIARQNEFAEEREHRTSIEVIKRQTTNRRRSRTSTEEGFSTGGGGTDYQVGKGKAAA